MPALSATTLVMPGSFTLDSPLHPKLDINAGAKSHIFQPPKSPSASGSLHLSQVSLTSHDARPNLPMKRKLYDAIDDGSLSPTLDVRSEMLCDSPAPLVSTQYYLAGGLNTPNSQLKTPHFVAPQRGRLLRPLDVSEPDDYFPDAQLAPALARERNGHARATASPSYKIGLGKAVFTVAGVAGRLWDFCRANAFVGFFAGGGQGYELGSPQQNCREKDSQLAWIHQDENAAITPIPGHFPDEDFIPNYMALDHYQQTNGSPSERAPKRVQRCKGSTEDEMSASWMVISSGDNGATSPYVSRETSPSPRKTPSASSASYSHSRPHRRPCIRPIGASSLSYHGRSSTGPYTSSPSSRHRHVTAGAGAANVSSPSAITASFAPARSPGIATKTTNTAFSNSEKRRSHHRSNSSQRAYDHGNWKSDSPLSEEVQRHAARLRRREVEEEANLQRLNQQLKAMIREGKEALGTRVEVEMIDDG